MKKKWSLPTLVLALCLTVFFCACDASERLTTPAHPLLVQEPIALTRGPYVQLATSAAIVIAWKTDMPASSRLDYGLTPSLDLRVESPTLTTQHAVTLTNLLPGTVYFYRVGSREQILSSVETFQTNPLDNRPFRFAVFGDSGTGTDAQLSVAEQLEASEPDLCLHTGDVIYPDGRAEFFDPRFFLPYKNIIKSVVIYLSLGNHDIRADNGKSYLEAFYLPHNNPQQTERYYSFDYGNAHFVALDTTQSFDAQSSQFIWLRDDLARTQKLWKFVFFHHAPYSSSSHALDAAVLEVRRNLAPVFDEFRVDIVFSGHDHDYERTFPLSSGAIVDWKQEPDYTAPGGTIYVVTGGGGGALYPSGKSSFTAFSQSVHHLTLVEVNGSQLLLQAITSDGKRIDQMTISKSQ